MMHQQGTKQGQLAEEGRCPVMLEDVSMSVENTADGMIVKITSKNPETVKKIQEHGAMMKDMAGKGGKAMSGCPGCPMMKKTDGCF